MTITPLVGGCVGCHGNGGSPPNLTAYSALVDRYKTKPGNTNILVTKGPHQGSQYFSAADANTVAAWIDGLQ